MSRRRIAGLAVLAALAAAPSGAAAPHPLQFRVFADTGIALTDVVWTGTQFLYAENTTNRIWAAGPLGAPLRPFASMPNEVEETRCRLSPGNHGFAAGFVYCHAPDNTIYRIGPDGSTTVFARLPDQSVSDGALAFDTVGKFGYALVAATGRSGAPEPSGGDVYTVDSAGRVRHLGSYPGPGGADEIAVAPASLGTGAGELVLTVDAGDRGAVVLMNTSGQTRTIASLPDGPNPVVAVPASPRHPSASPPPGLYVTDSDSHHVLFAPAAELAPFAGDLIVGSEIKALFWVIRPRPRGKGLQTLRLSTTLPAATYDLEGATYVAG